MTRYIFLDTWVLSGVTDSAFRNRLVTLVNTNNYTGLITSLTLVELYNPGWANAPGEDRVAKAIDFLSSIPCVIVDPQKVFRAEIDSYPNPLDMLPLELDLQEIPDSQRAQLLLQFMRRDTLFLAQGKDIEIWSQNYKRDKAVWLLKTENIVNHACETGILKRDEKGTFIDVEQNKELFLLSLDLRHTESEEEKDELFEKIVNTRKEPGYWFNLLAIRMTSLCIWYSYIDTDPTNKPRYRPSDMADHYHIGLIPYCAAFTIDNTMWDLVQRFQEQFLLSGCKLLRQKDIAQLPLDTAPI